MKVSSLMAHEEVGLISMPFGGIHMPSLALSLLSAELRREGIPTAVHYLNIPFAERIGIERYDRYAENLNFAYLGEWMFSDCLFPRPPEEGERFVEEVLIPLQQFTIGEIEQFEADRALAGSFLEECLRLVDWSRYKIIGFTTTFEQNTAALAFARMVKAMAPNSTIVFGGANCEGEMGVQLRQSFPWIDFVCTGEGDEVFPELALQILGRKPWAPLPGIVGAREISPPPAKMVTNLDQLPSPDFSGYFDRAESSPLHASLRSRLLMETSRGCWWGEKHHCTFCGLNGMGMRFRSKSSARALEELVELAARYKGRVNPSYSIYLTDNILDMKYLTTLLPALRETGLGISPFYETKANLSRDQVRTLAEAGVKVIQPGIESLHTELLRLMRKGCTAAQNIQLLKWCQEFHIRPLWNILFGFPGEDPRWFQEQVDTVGKLLHLTPPNALCPVRLDRFSPYFAESEVHGISRIRPARALSYIFPLPPQELSRIAYHFDFDFNDGRNPHHYIGALDEAVRDWTAHEHERFFYAFRWRGRLILWDTRHSSPGALHVLPDGERVIYEFCDKIRGRAEITACAQRDGGLSEHETERILKEWVEAGLLYEEQGCLLSLASLADGAVESRLDLSYAPTGDETPIRDRESPQRRSSRRPRRHPSASAIEMGDEVIVLDRDRGRLLILDGIASSVWKRCDGERTVEAIANEVASLVSNFPGSIRQGTAKVIESLEDEELLDSGADEPRRVLAAQEGPASRPDQTGR